MSEQTRTTPQDPTLGQDEITFLRALIVRHRTQEAERWLLNRGFNPVAMRRVMMQQETALVDNVKEKPIMDIVWAVGGLVTAFLLGLTAYQSSRENASFQAAEGMDEFIYIMEIFIILPTIFFLARAISRYFRFRKTLQTYPLPEEPLPGAGTAIRSN